MCPMFASLPHSNSACLLVQNLEQNCHLLQRYHSAVCSTIIFLPLNISLWSFRLPQRSGEIFRVKSSYTLSFFSRVLSVTFVLCSQWCLHLISLLNFISVLFAPCYQIIKGAKLGKAMSQYPHDPTTRLPPRRYSPATPGNHDSFGFWCFPCAKNSAILISSLVQ